MALTGIDESNMVLEALSSYLQESGVGDDDGVGGFYPNNTTPVTNLPESFVELLWNGSLSSSLSNFGIRSGVVIVILNVQLDGRGVVNTIRENYLLGKISDAVQRPFCVGDCHFSVDKSSLVYSGKNLTYGYSSKTITLNVKIY